MVANSCNALRRTTPLSEVSEVSIVSRQSGFTLVELLIGMALLLIMLTVAFTIFSSSNQIVESDTGRIMASQNTQAAADMIVNDLRQAGENLELELGISGVEFDSDAQRLIIRRSIPPFTAAQVGSSTSYIGQKPARLPVCNVSGTSLQVVGPPPGSTTSTSMCSYNTVSASDIDDARVKTWRLYFAAEGPQTALLYTPQSGGLPPKIMTVAVRSIGPVPNSSVASNPRRIAGTIDSAIPSTYTVNGATLLILIDERRYMVSDKELKLADKGQADTDAQPVAFDVSKMTVSANLTNPTETVTSMSATGPWSRLKSIRLELTGTTAGQGSNKSRTFQATVFPRNVETARGGK